LKVRRAVDGVYVYAQSKFLAKHFGCKDAMPYVLPDGGDETMVYADGRTSAPASMRNLRVGMFTTGYDGPEPNLAMLRGIAIGQGFELKFSDPISDPMVDAWLDAAERETQALHAATV
jgi:hypothetical protein